MNNIVVISGPSGSGKTTVAGKLKEKYSMIEFSVSHTTRKKRPEEKEGVDYYFVSEKKFREMISDGKFVEWAKVFDYLYGTSVDEIKKKSSERKVLLLDVDIQGASAIKKIFPEALLIFIEPPNYEKLKKRLINREKREDDDVRKRLEHSKMEMENSGFFDFHIINDKLKIALEEIFKIFDSYLKKSGLV